MTQYAEGWVMITKDHAAGIISEIAELRSQITLLTTERDRLLSDVNEIRDKYYSALRKCDNLQALAATNDSKQEV